MEKSYVSMEHALCPICNNVFPTGNILMDTRLRKVFDDKPITHYEICAECNKRIEEGYVALIVADHGEDTKEVELGQANRTGELMWLRKDVLKDIFNVTVQHGRPPFMFISKGAAEKIKEAAGAIA